MILIKKLNLSLGKFSQQSTHVRREIIRHMLLKWQTSASNKKAIFFISPQSNFPIPNAIWEINQYTDPSKFHLLQKPFCTYRWSFPLSESSKDWIQIVLGSWESKHHGILTLTQAKSLLTMYKGCQYHLLGFKNISQITYLAINVRYICTINFKKLKINKYVQVLVGGLELLWLAS